MPKKLPKTKLTIEFNSEEAARHFGLWLCESGEQHYWDWMRYRESEEGGPITARKFEYHPITSENPKRFGEFLGDLTIRTECGRLTEDLEDG